MIPDTDAGEGGQWEQRPTETARAFLVFATYRDLGPLRSLRKAAAVFYRGDVELVDAVTAAQLGQCKTWSVQHEWVARASAWDLYLEEISRETQIEEARNMRAQWGRLAAAMRAPIARTLTKMAEDQAVLTPAQLTDWMRVGHDVEGWAREMPVETAQEVADAGAEDDATILTDMVDELRRLRERRAQGS